MLKKSCRICKNKMLNVINFNKIALCGTFLNKNRIKKEKKYPISLAVCKKCKHIQIKNIINSKKLLCHY